MNGAQIFDSERRYSVASQKSLDYIIEMGRYPGGVWWGRLLRREPGTLRSFEPMTGSIQYLEHRSPAAVAERLAEMAEEDERKRID